MTTPKRLSQSRLWANLRDFYQEKGVEAWAKDDVPFFATNNPALAHTYCELFASFLDDCLVSGTLRTEEPAYLVELGGGMGRLAYLVLVTLEGMRERLPVEVKYLLTDYAESNVNFYRQHPRFAPFLESGRLEIQQYDAERGLLKVPGSNPIFCLANYLFDSLSQDGFCIRNGELYEVLFQEGESGEPDFITVPLQGAAYEREEYNRVLQNYAHRLGDTHVPFPVGPLDCLKQLGECSQNHFVLAMSDKALRNEEELLDFSQLPSQQHERGFSMSVNCHALDEVWKSLGGETLHSSPRATPLNIALYHRGFEASKLSRTLHTFEARVNGFGPLDYLDIRGQALDMTTADALPFYLNLLRMSHWDPELLYELSNKIGEAALGASVELQRELYTVLTSCWERYFPIPDERDVPFAVARVLACINQFQQAISFYQESLRLYGEQSLTHHNIGICLFNLSRLEEAEVSFQSALEIDSNYGPSRELLLRTQAERERREALKL